MRRFFCWWLSFAIVAVCSATLSDSAAAPHLGSVLLGPQMLAARSGHTATLLPNGKVLIAGGMRRNQDFYRSAELFDPATGRFHPTGNMHAARVGHAAVLLRSGKVLVAGGWIAGYGPTDSAELYDPATGSFTDIAKLPGKRARPSVTLLANGDVLFVGGADREGSGGMASAVIFHSEDLSFHSTGSMHADRILHTATLLKDGRVLIAGGRGTSVTAGAEIYDPATGTFTLTGKMITARYKHTAGILPDGRVLVAGGSDERDWHGNLSSAEVYDPSIGKFTTVSPLRQARFKLPDEAVMLPSGGLLVAGGSSQAELFDPRTQRFFPVPGDMQGSPHYMSETLLKDGSVLLAGGYCNDDRGTGVTWIYRP